MLIVVAVALAIAGAFAVCAAVCRWRIALDLRYDAESDRAATFVDIRWLWFHWRRERVAEGVRVEGSASSTGAGPSARRGFAVLRAVLATSGFPTRVRRLLAEMIRLSRPRELQARVRFGFDDPSDTGVLAGLLYALQYGAPSPGWDIHIEPDFARETLEGALRLEWSLRLVTIVWPLLTFLASPVVWRATRAAMRARRV